jgi:alpha-ketoglutarate-dependent taurine dioxygenase
MLAHRSDYGYRVGEFAVSAIPERETAAIQAIVTRYFGAEPGSEKLVPHPRQDQIRAEIKVVAPAVAALARAITSRLEDDYSGLILPATGLAGLAFSDRCATLYGLTLCMGRPTATDKVRRRVIWDVRARVGLKPGHVATFSEHSQEADLHTDGQYDAIPERYLMLYVEKAASCGGGVSQLRDIRCVIRELEKTAEGRWALDYLSGNDFPFRAPIAFSTNASKDDLDVTFAPILGRRPMVRYRTDTLESGLAAFPEYDTPDARRAIAIFRAELANEALRLDAHMADDTIVVINNQEIIHGRGEFKDQHRHLMRIRMSDDIPCDPSRTLHATRAA